MDERRKKRLIVILIIMSVLIAALIIGYLIVNHYFVEAHGMSFFEYLTEKLDELTRIGPPSGAEPG